MDKDDLWREYQEISHNIRWLGDVRFRLLALVPSVSGLAVAVLAQVDRASAAAALAVSLLGLVSTAGLLVYDLRNSEVYNALLLRVRYIERCLKLPSSGLRRNAVGQFGERPLPRGEGRLLAVTHGLGLALIYGSALGLWSFAVTHFAAVAAEIRSPDQWAGFAGFTVAVAAVVGLLVMKPTRSPTAETPASKHPQVDQHRDD